MHKVVGRKWQKLCLSTLLIFNGCFAELRQELVDAKQKLAEAKTRITGLESQVDTLRESHDKLQDEVTYMTHYTEAGLRQLSSQLSCTNKRVRDFLKQCEEDSEICTTEGVANALTYLDTQPYVLMFLRPLIGTSNLLLTRKGQLMSLGESKNWKPSTRFLVLVQPEGEKEEQIKESIRIGRDVVAYLRSEIGLARKVVIMGPKTLPCKMKADSISHYMRKFDHPIKGEPLENEPQIRVWVIRSDC